MVLAVACGISEADMARTEEAIGSTIAAQGTETGIVLQTEAVATHQYETEMAETAQAATATHIYGATATADRATRQVNAQNTLAARMQEAIALSTEQASDIYQIVESLYDMG